MYVYVHLADFSSSTFSLSYIHTAFSVSFWTASSRSLHSSLVSCPLFLHTIRLSVLPSRFSGVSSSRRRLLLFRVFLLLHFLLFFLRLSLALFRAARGALLTFSFSLSFSLSFCFCLSVCLSFSREGARAQGDDRESGRPRDGDQRAHEAVGSDGIPPQEIPRTSLLPFPAKSEKPSRQSLRPVSFEKTEERSSFPFCSTLFYRSVRERQTQSAFSFSVVSLFSSLIFFRSPECSLSSSRQIEMLTNFLRSRRSFH